MNQDDPLIHRIACFLELGRLTINQDFTGIGRLDASQDLHQCAFACTIFPDDREDFALFERKTDFVKRTNTRKGFRKFVDLK